MHPHLTPLLPPAPLACARGGLARRRRWAVWAGLVLCLWSGYEVAAQGRFNGKNSSTSKIYGADELPLSRVTGRVEILVGDTVLSTAKNTFTADGIFSLGILTVPNAPAGTSVLITIRAWDITAGSTYEAAVSAHYGYAATMVDVVGLAAENTLIPALDRFTGLKLEPRCVGDGIPPPSTVTIQEGQPTPLFVDFVSARWDAFCSVRGQPAEVIARYNQSLANNRPGFPTGLAAGNLSGVVPQLTYTPQLHRYGTDVVYYEVCATGCAGIGLGSGIIFIDIQPAIHRFGPALVAVFSESEVKPKLRGLDGRRYRLEKSADLKAWALAGEVTGNFSEVDLSPFLAPDDRAQFFRASEITGP